MTPNAQRIAIAEACGWTEIRHNPRTEVWDGVPPKEQEHQWDVLVPDYLTDLNAMHEAEKLAKITHDSAVFDIWCRHLFRIVEGCELSGTTARPLNRAIVKATAAQRAEAFLRTLNLYTP